MAPYDKQRRSCGGARKSAEAAADSEGNVGRLLVEERLRAISIVLPSSTEAGFRPCSLARIS